MHDDSILHRLKGHPPDAGKSPAGIKVAIAGMLLMIPAFWGFIYYLIKTTPFEPPISTFLWGVFAFAALAELITVWVLLKITRGINRRSISMIFKNGEVLAREGVTRHVIWRERFLDFADLILHTSGDDAPYLCLYHHEPDKHVMIPLGTREQGEARKKAEEIARAIAIRLYIR